MLTSFDVIFWDFDGVIMDSVDAKASAFLSLFPDSPPSFKRRVLNHHLANGGVSRFSKISTYLSWLGHEPDDDLILKYSSLFSSLVVDQVISSPWVPEVIDFIRSFHTSIIFVIVTATPLEEILFILKRLQIAQYFVSIYGHPTSKVDAINQFLSNKRIPLSNCVFVGDSQSDFDASIAVGLPFLLRATSYNQKLVNKLQPNQIFSSTLS